MKRIFTLFFSLILFSIYSFSQTKAEDILNKVETLQAENQSKIDAAFAAMEAVQQAGAYIESLSELFTNAEIALPVGIKNGDYELIVQKIEFNETNERANIFATVAFKFKDDGQKIAFEGSSSIEGKKGLGSYGYLELTSPVSRNIGQQASLIIDSGTKVNFGCDGVESFEAKLNLVVTSEKIVAVDKSGKETGGSITTEFDAKFFDFDNFTASFTIDQYFMFSGLKDVIFSLKGATIDQSDEETSSMVKFPDGYFSGENTDEKKLWKGFAITEASIALPAIFDKKNAQTDTSQTTNSEFDNRIVISLNRVLIDENGFTGDVSAEGIMHSSTLDKDSWCISATDFMLSLQKNQITEFGFGGDINIPPLGDNSLLPYTATFNPSIQEYEFQVNIGGDYDLPVLRSTLSLNETSTLEIMFKNAEIYPTLNGSGYISVNAPITKEDSTQKFSLPDVSFENLKISRDKPYLSIGAIGLTGTITSPKIAGFELSISDIQPINDTANGGISFTAGVKLNETFGGDAGLQLYGDYTSWKFDRVNLEKINVWFKSKAYSIEGGIWFKNGDAIYGTGFRGNVEFNLIDKFTFDAVAVFGKVNDYRYFLTDVYFEASPTTGILVPPALTFYGFGGGLYRHMQQSTDESINSEFGKSLSDINYIPDESVGMGFMTSTKFGFSGSDKAFNANVSFEMQFNNNWGLNFIQFRGEASFMDLASKFGSLSSNITEKVKELEKAGGKLKVAAKSDLSVPANKEGGFLTASLNVKLDLEHSIFSADLSTYLNAGVIKGIGDGDRLGWASAYFSDDKWYTYLGTPSDRLGVEVLGLAQLDGYFMIGNDIPDIPAPPQKVLQNFSAANQAKFANREGNQAALGSGIAFGQSLSVDFKATLPPFYAAIGAGLGSEFLLVNLNDKYCAGQSSTPGINGWYAKAQAWAWVAADIGMEAKVFGKKKSFSILDISASCLLAGSGPNPMYFTGMVGGRFNVFGGLISGQCDFDFEIGDECKLVGGSPFGEDVIADLAPSDAETDVNVFAATQAVFNIPIDLAMEVAEDEGGKAWYKINLDQFTVRYKDTKQEINGYAELSEDGKLFVLDPDEPFESQKEIEIIAEVSFQRKVDGKWQNVKGEDGKNLIESKTVTFKTGDRPEEILPEHVKYSYPIARQYNYYPEEYNKGYILVSENYSYLFTTDKPEGYNQKLRFTDVDGNEQETSFTFKTNSAGNSIRLEIDFSTQSINFTNNEIYNIALMNIPISTTTDMSSNIVTTTTQLNDTSEISVNTQSAEGEVAVLQEKEIYGHYFRTSKYNTLKEKIDEFDIEHNGWRSYVEPYVHKVGANITEDEFFDKFELFGNSNIPPLIQILPNLESTSWYKNSIYKKMYNTLNVSTISTTRSQLNANFNSYGYPPQKGIIYFNNMVYDKILTDDEINSSQANTNYPYGIISYNVPYWCSRDFYLHQQRIALDISWGNSVSTYEENLVSISKPPVVIRGDYPLITKYILPGKEITTSTFAIPLFNPVVYN